MNHRSHTTDDSTATSDLAPGSISEGMRSMLEFEGTTQSGLKSAIRKSDTASYRAPCSYPHFLSRIRYSQFLQMSGPYTSQAWNTRKSGILDRPVTNLRGLGGQVLRRCLRLPVAHSYSSAPSPSLHPRKAPFPSHPSYLPCPRRLPVSRRQALNSRPSGRENM